MWSEKDDDSRRDCRGRRSRSWYDTIRDLLFVAAAATSSPPGVVTSNPISRRAEVSPGEAERRRRQMIAERCREGVAGLEEVEYTFSEARLRR